MDSYLLEKLTTADPFESSLQKLPPGAPATEIEQKVRTYLHVMGTDAEQDRKVFGYGVVPTIDVDPTHFAIVTASPNSRYAIGFINSGVSPNSEYYIEPLADLGKTNSSWGELANFSDDVSDVEVHSDELYVLTYKNAPRYKVLRLDARHHKLSSAETVIPPSEAVASGILIGRAITERPDLWGAAIDVVGCSDMLRAENTANGVPNVPEFGSTKTEKGFKELYAMSAYHHIKNRTAYPAVLLETGYNDPRVDPWHMARMTAALRAATSSGNPVLLRVEYEVGPGNIGGTEKQVQ